MPQLETFPLPSLDRLIPQPRTAENITPRREAALRRLLDSPYGDDISMGNYEYARDSGLIDLFAYDPDRHLDGLQHTLSGVVVPGVDGSHTSEGFHHEPSGFYGEVDPDSTRVDLEHLELLNSKSKAEFKRAPFEPYKAKTFINGEKKITPQINEETGATEMVEAKNGMFPEEYDALAVMQAIRIALETRDKSKDVRVGNTKVVGEGYAPMIDGESLMKIRLVLDSKDLKVRSAFPIVKVGGIMKLSEAAIKKHLYMAS